MNTEFDPPKFCTKCSLEQSPEWLGCPRCSGLVWSGHDWMEPKKSTKAKRQPNEQTSLFTHDTEHLPA